MREITVTGTAILIPPRNVVFVPIRMPRAVGSWRLGLYDNALHLTLLALAIDGARIVDAYRIGGFPCGMFSSETMFHNVGLPMGCEVSLHVVNQTDVERTLGVNILERDATEAAALDISEGG